MRGRPVKPVATCGGMLYRRPVGLIDRLFGKGRRAAGARAAEVRGDLPRAVELFVEAEQPEEAARVVLLRAEAETDARARLQLFTQAASLAPKELEVGREARRKRATLLLVLAGDAALSAVARHDVIRAALELEEIGDAAKAAEAYALAGDKEGEARALAAAGDVEGLELLLSMEQHRERSERALNEKAADVDVLIASGRRREALEALEVLAAASPTDGTLRERVSALRSRRALGPLLPLEIAGERFTVALGEEIVIGRTEGALQVPSAAVSRQHLRIERAGGEIVVKDLESRNGTQLRGVKLAGAISIHEGLELKLGREVPLRVAPSRRFEGAVDVDVAGQRYVAPLGVAKVPGTDWEIVTGPDGWVELRAPVSAPAYLGEVELHQAATLLTGDAISKTRGGEPVLRVAG